MPDYLHPKFVPYTKSEERIKGKSKLLPRLARRDKNRNSTEFPTYFTERAAKVNVKNKINSSIDENIPYVEKIERDKVLKEFKKSEF